MKTPVCLAATAVIMSACGGDSSGPALAVCTTSAATRITLSAPSYQIVDATLDSGCLDFPANASSDSAEYLIVAQSAGGTPGDSAPFALRSGGPGVAAAVAARAARRHPAYSARLRQLGPVAARFDLQLRQRRVRTAARIRAARRAATAATRAALTTAPALGSMRRFAVCADYACDAFDSVTAQVQAVGAHSVVYVDQAAPSGGLTTTQVDSLQQLFDRLYVVDTVAFSGISDIDTNGVVLVLMTGVVNHLVTTQQCNAGGYVAGFFLGDDLDPTAPQSNHGEIFYTVVADPSGSLSCSHTASELEAVLPSTFLHELQHVISFNQHVLVRNGNEEDLWLDEALSSFAEELGGRSFLPDSNAFSQFLIGDVYNAYQYLLNPSRHFLLQESDTVLPDFGAGWLYMRYLVDQFGAGLTTQLEQTTLTGTANVANRTGVGFETTVGRWALANWVSDLPGLSPPAELRYTSWSFRALFASLAAQDPFDFPLVYPLVPTVAQATAMNLTGVLAAGSGAYVRALQAPGSGGFSVLLNNGTGPISTAMVPRLDVIRIR